MRNIISCTKIILLIALGSNFCYGQKSVNLKSDTIQWDYGRGENKARSENLTISGRLISYGDKKFIWIQNGTDTKYSFDVKSVKGDWLNTNENGEIIYQAVCEGVDGAIRIFRRGRDMSIHLDFTVPEKLTPNIILQINSYSKI